MRILFATDEATPIFKIGGLGDVGSALPKSLSALNQDIDIRIALPKHPEINFIPSQWQLLQTFPVVYDQKPLDVKVYLGYLPNTTVPTYLFEESTYLSQHTDASDNHADKFAVFSLCISAFLRNADTIWQPHIIHINDWHTALIPVILKHRYHTRDYKYVITIHNLAYQGDTNTPVLQKLNIPPQCCHILNWDQQDNYLNILMEGLLHADHITTVSPTYAKEILTTEYGEKLQEILNAKTGRLTGIVNGLDIDFFNPDTDEFLSHTYNVSNYAEHKHANKNALQKELNLNIDHNQLISYVGRVDGHQKGIEHIIKALEDQTLPLPETQFVFLGTGDKPLEDGLLKAGSHPNVRIIIKYDESLAHRIYAASDLTLIPSKFEPCGLVQLIAMRYGSLPVAHQTGGLIDTIDHQHTGFLYEQYDAKAMIDSLHQAIRYIQDPTLHHNMVTTAMSQDFSWKRSAFEYAKLYEKLLLS